MTTLTPTQARVNFSTVLRQALRGDDIGIIVRGQVVALRPIEVASCDYAEAEYGLTRAQMRHATRKIKAHAGRNVRAGKSKTFHGDIESLLRD